MDSRGKEDPIAKSKMAECIVALSLSIEIDALDWEVGNKLEDPGYDVTVPGGIIQVKHTEFGRCLLWPVKARHKYAGSNFSHMALVTGNNRIGFEHFGYITKEKFYATKKIGHPMRRPKMDHGTWYVEGETLSPFRE